MSRLTVRWYLRISRNATVPGRYRCGLSAVGGSGQTRLRFTAGPPRRGITTFPCLAQTYPAPPASHSRKQAKPPAFPPHTHNERHAL